VFDETGVPVDSYAAAFYREMEHCVAGTGTPGPRERRFELRPGCYPAPVTEAHLLVKHVERSEPKTHVTYGELGRRAVDLPVGPTREPAQRPRSLPPAPFAGRER